MVEIIETSQQSVLLQLLVIFNTGQENFDVSFDSYNISDFRLLLRCKWDLRSFGILLSHIFKDQAVQDWPTGCTETSVGNWRSTLRKIPKERRSYNVKFTELICDSCCTRHYLLVTYTSGIWAGSVTLLGVLLETTCDTYGRDVWVNNVAPLSLAVAWKTTKVPRTDVCMGTLISLCIFHCFTVHFVWLSFIYTNVCTCF